MKKWMMIGALGIAAALAMAGCSKKDDTIAAKETTEAVPAGSVELGEYKGVHVTMEPAKVTDEQLEQTIQSILDSNPDQTEVDRPSQEKDVVNIDYVGKKDGVAFDRGSEQNFDFVIGETNFIEGFKEGLIGVKKGDNINLDLTFPDPYPMSPDLAGQSVVFEVTVNSVKERHDAQLNDEFVRRISEFDAVDEWREDLRARLLEQSRRFAEEKAKTMAADSVIANSTFTGVDPQIEAQFEQAATMAALYGMDVDSYLMGMLGMDRDGYRELIESQIKFDLVSNAIAKKEGLKADEADREQLAKDYGAESAAELVEYYGEEAVAQQALGLKVRNFLLENAVVDQAEPAEADESGAEASGEVTETGDGAAASDITAGAEDQVTKE